MTKTVISSRGQVAIPKAIRERLHLSSGAEVLIEVQGEAIVLKRLAKPTRDWRSMRGMLRGGSDLLQELAQEHAREAAHDDARSKQGH